MGFKKGPAQVNNFWMRSFETMLLGAVAMTCMSSAQMSHLANGIKLQGLAWEVPMLSRLGDDMSPVSIKNPTTRELINQGKSKQAMEAAREIARRIDPKTMVQPGMEAMQHLYASPLYGMARFGMWDEILQQPMPAKDALYLRGVWHFARGLAHIRKGHEIVAEMEIKDLERLQADPKLKGLMLDGMCPVERVMVISLKILKGELAAKQMKYDEAIAHLTEAVAMEDKNPYMEPAYWTYSTRLVLGAILIEAGKAAEAERIYLEDLKDNPENGWTLFGLAQAYEKQGKWEAAAKAKARFGLAWKNADLKLSSSRM